MVNREGEESAVGVCTHTRSSSSLGEQTDLCVAGTERETKENINLGTYRKCRRSESAEGHKGNHPSNYITDYYIDEP